MIATRHDPATRECNDAVGPFPWRASLIQHGMRNNAPMTARRPSLLRAAALVGAAALLSRVLGFARDVGMAWLLGNSLAADALVIALRLPHVLRRLFGEGALSMALTADFARGAHQVGPLAPQALAAALQWRLACVLGAAVLAAEAAARPLAILLAPGMIHDSALMAQTEPLLRLCLPYALTAGMAALAMARLHSAGRFLAPALAPAVFNLAVLAAIAVAALRGESENAAARLLAAGVLCGGLAQWLLQLPALRRLRLPAAAPAPPPGAAWRCLARLPLGILGAAAPQLAMLAAMAAASWLPHGGVAALYYAERLMELPLSVAGAALGMTSLPILARLAAHEDHHAFARETSRALRLSLCFTLPAAAGLLTVADPLALVLFARGAFDSEAARATALALCGYAPGLPAYGLTRPLLAACHAAGQNRSSVQSGILAIAAALAGSFLGTALLPPAHALLGPPLGVSAGLWVQALFLYNTCRRRLNAQGAALSLRPRSLAQQAAASLLSAWAALVAIRNVTPVWLGLALAVGAGVLLYALTLLACGNPELVRSRTRAGDAP